MRQKRSERGKGFLIFFLGMLVGGLLVSRRMTATSKYVGEFFKDLEKKYFRMEEISYRLGKEYYDQEALSGAKTQMIESASKAFVDGLGDPYTSYLDAETYSGLQTELEGEDSIEGIGAVVGKKDYYVQVEEIIKNSPAYKAGLMPLDRIIMIGTGEVKDLTTQEAVLQIRGPKGTTVDLFIERVDKEGNKEYQEIEITRDIIDVPSVTSKVFNKDGLSIGYIEVSVFGDQTNKLFTRAISDILEEKAKGVIVDLRGNGGGLLTSAVELAGHFIPKGEIIVKTKYSVFKDVDYPSTGFGELQYMPVVVLVDGLTASSSEILTLALKEKLGAKIVGTKTFGKGSIQTLYDFDDGTSLKYTVGKRFSPSGVTIDKEGIIPDIESSVDITGYIENGLDTQLETAKDVLAGMMK